MTPYYEQDRITIYHGDYREVLPSALMCHPGIKLHRMETDRKRRSGSGQIRKGYNKGDHMTILRQGDVLVKRTRKKPSAKAKTITDCGRTVLAYGEVTGHAHEVVPEIMDPATDDHVPVQQLFEEPDGTRLLVVRGPVTLRHEEHAPLSIPEGTYEVIRQREYSPEAIRNVAD